MGVVWSLVFGRRFDVNRNSFRVIKKIGEGGEINGEYIITRPKCSNH